MTIDTISKVSSVVSLPSKSAVTPQEPAVDSLATPQPNKAELEAAVKKLNEIMAQSNTAVEFSLDQSTGSTVIKVVDTETNHVLRQLPNLEAIAFSRSLDTFKGLLLNQKV